MLIFRVLFLIHARIILIALLKDARIILKDAQIILTSYRIWI